MQKVNREFCSASQSGIFPASKIDQRSGLTIDAFTTLANREFCSASQLGIFQHKIDRAAD